MSLLLLQQQQKLTFLKIWEILNPAALTLQEIANLHIDSKITKCTVNKTFLNFKNRKIPQKYTLTQTLFILSY
jgi:hypothetical protein